MKEIKGLKEKETLLDNLQNAILKIKYISSVNEYPKTFMPHHKKAIDEAIAPVIDAFFKENDVVKKDSLWKE